MNEEEIIKTLKVLIGLEEFNKLSYKENKAIQGLLDLYNNEKEKNKELQVEKLELLEKIEMKKILIMRKNHITKEIFGELYIKKDELEQNYISKDKIKKEIEEYKKYDNGKNYENEISGLENVLKH